MNKLPRNPLKVNPEYFSLITRLMTMSTKLLPEDDRCQGLSDSCVTLIDAFSRSLLPHAANVQQASQKNSDLENSSLKI